MGVIYSVVCVSSEASIRSRFICPSPRISDDIGKLMRSGDLVAIESLRGAVGEVLGHLVMLDAGL